MKLKTFRWVESSGWDIGLSSDPAVDLVLVFADHPFFTQPQCYEDLRGFFPEADIVGCSSSGNILGNTISDQDIVISAITFENSHVLVSSTQLDDGLDIESATAHLTKAFSDPKPKHLFCLSDGLSIPGSQLTRALNLEGIAVTGGLAGDADRFSKSWVMVNGPAKQHQLALIGFYGDVQFSYGFATGWSEFGPERRVTRSDGGIVYEIDHKPALEVYTKYLGELSQQLPGSGLRFPLSVKDAKSGLTYIRTLLGVDQAAQSLSFAGDVPQDSLCKLMKANIESLIDAGAALAKNLQLGSSDQARLCLAVSCVGRRLVMNQISEEEIEAIQNILGSNTTIFGFYSYGEIAPFGNDFCSLHNQTTTLTLLTE